MFQPGDKVIVDLPGSIYDRLVGVVVQSSARNKWCSVSMDGFGFPTFWWANLCLLDDASEDAMAADAMRRNGALVLAIIGDDRPAPNGDTWETTMLHRLARCAR